MQQDCQGDDLECVNLICSTPSDSGARTPLRDIGIQTSITDVEKKNASTSFDHQASVQEKKTKKVATRNCKIA